jgi:hypothetical protein
MMVPISVFVMISNLYRYVALQYKSTPLVHLLQPRVAWDVWPIQRGTAGDGAWVVSNAASAIDDVAARAGSTRRRAGEFL